MNDAAQTIADAVGHGMYARDKAAQALGITLLDIRQGYARMSMAVRDDMLNGHATCHGGFIFTLADSAFAFACNSYDQRVVAAQCAITFLAPARLGDRLTAKGTERQRFGRNGIYDITVTRADGAPIAEFRGHARTVKGRFLPEGGA
jgi:acyl-CoA thioesterase